jgi:hypothetical protein
MHRKKKVPTHRVNVRRAIQAHRPLQPADPVESDELGDTPMSMQIVLKPCLTQYVRALFVHTRATIELVGAKYSYQ